MPRFFADPPQGHEAGQELRTEGGFSIPLILPPQGLDSVGIPLFLLDLFPDAAVAYSLRLLRTAYSGPAIRVRRTSDGTEQDIGFLADGNLDLPALTLFVGASDGQVKIWYDQSGNALDLDDNADNTKLPLIIIAGVLQKSNNVVSMLFDDINDNLNSTNSLSTPASHLFIFTVGRKLTIAGNVVLFNLNSPDSPNNVRVIISGAGTIIWDAGPSGTNRLTSPISFNDTFHHILGFSKTAGVNNQKILRDSVEIASRTQGSTSTVLDKITVEANTPTGNSTAFFEYQELIFYDSDQLANFVAISDAMISYWKGVEIATELSEPITTELMEPLVTEA